MALKKSDLYSSLWASCDQLRGGMDASQYKDFILTLLFVKYVSDKAKSDPNSLIDVYGHTDSTGSDQYNQTLSENRARTVANYLTMQGVSAARIRSQGFGETLPIADNATEEGRRRNRRVEITVR